jgi:DNA invertase Pin-like site-specific DNA recombinase
MRNSAGHSPSSTFPALRLDGYVRVSRVGGRQGENFVSPLVQRELIEGWAQARGGRLLTVFEEMDESGTRSDRPMLRQAMRRIDAGVSQGLVVARVDRFGRSLLDGLEAIEQIRRAGGRFFAVRDGLDSESDAGRLVLRILLSVGEWELDRIRGNWHDAQARAVARGAWPCSTVPAGYRRTRSGRLLPNANTAPLIAEVFRRRAAGATMTGLARFLEAASVPTARGGACWSATTIGHLLANRVYLGEVRWGDHLRERAHPPLVDAATWQVAQHPRQLSYGGAPSGVLLIGFVRCASCGMRMAQKPRRKDGRTRRSLMCRCYFAAGRCPRPAYVSNAQIEPYVVDVMFELLQRRRRAPDNAVREAAGRLATVEAALVAYRDSERIAAALEETVFALGLAVRTDRVRQARLELANAKSRCTVHELPDVKEIEDGWPGMDFEERRQFLGAVIDCVFVAPGRRNPADRITVCPAGTAPAMLAQRGDRNVQLQTYAPRAAWINPGRLGWTSWRWSPTRLERELRSFIGTRTSWPPRSAFVEAGRDRLHHQVVLHGGELVWAHRLGVQVRTRNATQAPWTDDRIRAGLAVYLDGKSAWPPRAEFERDGLTSLRVAVTRHGGLRRWATEFPIACPQRNRPGCPRTWTDERIREQLAGFCAGKEIFPSQRLFREAGLTSLLAAMIQHGGVRRWAEEVGLPRASNARSR